MSEEILSRIVENFIDGATVWKGFDLKSATPIRKTDLDDSYARCALAIKIDAATQRAVIALRLFKANAVASDLLG
jgi:hypothetical protein